MPIEKAIEILDHMSKSTNVSSLEDCIEAIKLGIEALKRINSERAKYTGWSVRPLPGETED